MSKSVFETFGNLQGLEIADIGSGSGIESIVAVMAGAKHVDAADVNQQAVECSKHNVELNGLQESIQVFYSDLFKNFPKKKYGSQGSYFVNLKIPMMLLTGEREATMWFYFLFGERNTKNKTIT